MRAVFTIEEMRVKEINITPAIPSDWNAHTLTLAPAPQSPAELNANPNTAFAQRDHSIPQAMLGLTDRQVSMTIWGTTEAA